MSRIARYKEVCKCPDKSFVCYASPLMIRGRAILWLGWIFFETRSPSTFYYDNTPTVSITYESGVKHLMFGLTSKSVLKKLRNKIDKMTKEEEVKDENR